MEITRFYSENNPQVEELVLCIVKERNQEDNVIKLYLPDYNTNAIMSFKKATNKKKVRSWNNIIPLNKEIICKVESINTRNDEKFIEVSKAYIDLSSDYVKKFNEEQKNNYKLKAIFKMLDNIYEDFNYKNNWENIIYPFDKLRKEENSDLFLFDYILTKYEEFISKFKPEYQTQINKFINKNKKTDKNKFKTKFGMYSKYYNDTINIIKKSLENIDDVDVKIDKVPYFLVYGPKENIRKFCQNLLENSSEKDKSYLLQNNLEDFEIERIN